MYRMSHSNRTFCLSYYENSAEQGRCAKETVKCIRDAMYRHLTAIGHIMAGGKIKAARMMIGEGQPLRPNNGLAEEE